MYERSPLPATASEAVPGVVFDPVAQAVTYLVVEWHGLERLVPLDHAARGEIWIR